MKIPMVPRFVEVVGDGQQMASRKSKWGNLPDTPLINRKVDGRITIVSPKARLLHKELRAQDTYSSHVSLFRRTRGRCVRLRG
jgi:hypothetical protein